MSVREEVVQILSHFFTAEDINDLEENESLIDAGLIDSLGMMELVSKIEKQFNLKVDFDDLVPENFDSLAAITRYIIDKK